MFRRKHSHDNKANFNMDTSSFIVNIKTEDVCKDTAKDVEKRFDASNYEIERPLPIVKSKNVTGLMNNDLDGNIMAEFVGIR